MHWGDAMVIGKKVVIQWSKAQPMLHNYPLPQPPSISHFLQFRLSFLKSIRLFAECISPGSFTLYYTTWKERAAPPITAMDAKSWLCGQLINKKPYSEELRLVWETSHCGNIIKAARYSKTLLNHLSMKLSFSWLGKSLLFVFCYYFELGSFIKFEIDLASKDLWNFHSEFMLYTREWCCPAAAGA